MFLLQIKYIIRKIERHQKEYVLYYGIINSAGILT